jgi:predicted enzyme related to lactoylglutathione lyase
MMNPVGFFEIPVNDMARATVFYNAVFGVEFEFNHIDGNEMAFFPTDENQFGISGALSKGTSYTPSKQGTRIYFSVISIEEALSKEEQSNGKTLYPKTSIGELGWVAEFEDSEGNCIALHAPATPNATSN